jgi:hypothetical protein
VEKNVEDLGRIFIELSLKAINFLQRKLGTPEMIDSRTFRANFRNRVWRVPFAMYRKRRFALSTKQVTGR